MDTMATSTESSAAATQKPTSRTPKRIGLSSALVKLLKSSLAPYQLQKPAVTSCIDTIAISLERDGDAAGAASVRALLGQADNESAAGTAARTMQPINLSTADADAPLTWHPPGPVEAIFESKFEAGLERIVMSLLHVSRFASMGIDPPARLLFAGPSGVGKTLTARWLGWKLGLPVGVVSIDKAVRSYMGETSQRYAKVFEATKTRPCVLFLDEVDALTVTRGKSKDAAETEMGRSTSTLLQQLDSLPVDQIVIAATNVVEAIDPALQRRLPLRLDFPLPDRFARRRMLDTWLAKVDPPLSDSFYRSLIGESDEMSPAAFRSLTMERTRELLLRTWEEG